MSILFYCGKSNKSAEMIKIIIEGQASGEPIEIFSTIKDLSARLCRPRYDLILMIVLVSSQKELAELLSLHELIADIKIILILPDRKKDTIDKGHKLYPRFISYIDGDFSNVALVLNKMMRNFHAKEKFKSGDTLQPEAKQSQTGSQPGLTRERMLR